MRQHSVKINELRKYWGLIPNRNLLKNHWPVFLMLLLPVVVLGPALGRGYILRYDMVFSPHVHLGIDTIGEGVGLYQYVPLMAVLKVLSFGLPMDIVQKLILFAIFFLAAYTMYRSVPVKSTVARLVAGSMYAINPFTYDRLMAGHWRFLLAYSITPLVVKGFYALFTKPCRSNFVYAAAWWMAAVLLNVHHIMILGLVFVCFAIFFVRDKRTALYTVGLVLAMGLLNLWWIIPAYTTNNVTHSFDLAQFYAFATQSDMAYGIWFNMISLQGFWFSDWQSIKDASSLWPLVVFGWLVLVFVGVGGWSAYKRNHQKLLAGLALASVVAFVFASGPYPAFSSMNTWLYTHVPGLSAMREPQKFLAIVALMYAFAAAKGLDVLLQRRLVKSAASVGVVFILSTIVLMQPMFWACAGQLKPIDYPSSWHNFYEYLQQHKDTGKVIVLPWDLYTDSTFTDTLVANPAQAFYGGRVIQSKNMNISTVKDEQSSQHIAIDQAIQSKDAKQILRTMQSVDANYIMITEISKKSEYDWMLSTPDLYVLMSNPQAIIIARQTR